MPQKFVRGWIPDLPDQRDHMYAIPLPFQHPTALPASVDLRPNCPPVYDQGQLGSCTANAIAASIEFNRMKEDLTPIFVPSRLFIYYNERAMEGTVNTDSGAQIRDGIKSVGGQGACIEDSWPYDITQFQNQPPDPCYQEALQHRAIQYQRIVHNINLMKGCLASGYPFVFGFTVYESFESDAVAQSGHAPMPGPNEQTLGGHAVMAVGYDDSQNWFIIRNSWGTGWGMEGYFTLPYDYLTNDNLADDLWTIRLVQ
jgi:C1A family cysteine protease